MPQAEMEAKPSNGKRSLRVRNARQLDSNPAEIDGKHFMVTQNYRKSVEKERERKNEMGERKEYERKQSQMTNWSFFVGKSA